jgi:hypothetical protein
MKSFEPGFIRGNVLNVFWAASMPWWGLAQELDMEIGTIPNK